MCFDTKYYWERPATVRDLYVQSAINKAEEMTRALQCFDIVASVYLEPGLNHLKAFWNDPFLEDLTR